MPLYEYSCSACGEKFEILRKASQAGETVTCSQCGAVASRVLSTFASFSVDVSGANNRIGGNSCSGCSAHSCNSCNR
jgi:putative FmdB family regulatory protein